MWSLIFLLDRERGGHRRHVIAGLLVVVLVVVSHLWLSGPWMRQVGLGTDARPAVAPGPVEVVRDTLTGLLNAPLR